MNALADLKTSFPADASEHSWHGVPMKRVGWYRRLCLGSCLNAKERHDFNDLTSDSPALGAEVFRSRATIAQATGAQATAATALGALAIGSLAIGFLAIGRLIIRDLLIQQVHLRRLKIDQLEVEELRVRKLTIVEDRRSTTGPENGNG